ncbi:MAG: hypothetical protein A3H96_10290 [Acidobacteria bacterium RIFCSPLOWO2_02_FULL_67_36]|nr:MAG: hypothetical protein A3H96_10290 [Acidobacteria bacterium RIFCSPLOWO2_02_FULL_67_36]OFW24431.1 MAG: hypothetical protein A3G21_17880 [Acidobacteria bacterium RIFCSPLOWO2_12_FULL_66_21]
MKGIQAFRRTAALLACVSALTLAGIQPAVAGGQSYGLSGRVTNQSGSPLAGSVVDVFEAGTTTLAANAVTDPDGVYSTAISAGTYDIRVTPPPGTGFGTATAPGRTITGNTTLDFVLVPIGSVTLSGRVLDGQGVPLPNQYVVLTPSGGADLPQIQTDTDGNYSFSVASGDYAVTVWGYPSAPAAAPTYYYFRLTSGLTLTGNLTFDLKLPVKRVDVHVQTPDGNPVVNAALTTTGIYSYIGIGPATGYGFSNYYSWYGRVRAAADADDSGREYPATGQWRWNGCEQRRSRDVRVHRGSWQDRFTLLCRASP